MEDATRQLAVNSQPVPRRLAHLGAGAQRQALRLEAKAKSNAELYAGILPAAPSRQVIRYGARKAA